METNRVIVLASYCGDNPECTEDRPCKDCLGMCNVFEIEKREEDYQRKNYRGTLDYLRDNE